MSNFTAGLFDKFRRPGQACAPRPAGLGSLILPQSCALCAAPTSGAPLCGGCEAGAPRVPAACPCCALPSRDTGRCADCRRHPPPFSAARAAFAYAWPVDHLLHALKYDGELLLAGWFARAIVDCGPVGVELLAAIPLAPARQRSRGYNQAAEIARHIARLTGLPLVDGLTRVRDTESQVGLTSAQRARNLAGAFVASEALAGRRVALVDDVMTTGATMRAAAQATARAGALATEAWVAARTLSPESA